MLWGILKDAIGAVNRRFSGDFKFVGTIMLDRVYNVTIIDNVAHALTPKRTFTVSVEGIDIFHKQVDLSQIPKGSFVDHNTYFKGEEIIVRVKNQVGSEAVELLRAEAVLVEAVFLG